MVDFSLFEKIKDKILIGNISPTAKIIENEYYDMEERLSENRLNEIIKKYGDLHIAEDEKNQARWTYGTHKYTMDEWELNNSVEKAYNCSCKVSGRFLYLPNGYCGWHTNSNSLGERIYIVWAAEDNKSFFRYKDKETNKIITKWEKKGWQVNRFHPPIWHCVGSYTNRISFGYRVVEQTNWRF